MKVLIYENRKVDARVWNISTPLKRAKAFLSLFQFLSDEWNCYDELEGNPDEADFDQIRWYHKAEAGDGVAAENLLASRLDYEYEYYQICEVE